MITRTSEATNILPLPYCLLHLLQASRTPSVGRSRCIINCQKCDIVKAEERGYIFVPGKDSRVVLGE